MSLPRLRKFFFDVRWYVIRTKTSAFFFFDTLRPLALFLLCHCRGFASFFFDVRWYVIRTKTSAFFDTLRPLAMFQCHCRGFASFFLTYGGTSYVRKLRLFFDTLRPLAMFHLCHCRGFASFFFYVRWYVIRTKTSAFF